MGFRVPNRALYGVAFLVLLMLGAVAALRLQELESSLNASGTALTISGRISYLSGLVGRTSVSVEALARNHDAQLAADLSANLLKIQSLVSELEQHFQDEPAQLVRFRNVRKWVDTQFTLLRKTSTVAIDEEGLAMVRATIAAISNDDLTRLRGSLDKEHDLADSSRLLFWLLSVSSLSVLVFTVARATGDKRRRSAAESALAAREAQYRQVVESAGDIIYRTDKVGRFTFCNQSALNMLHWTEEEVLGRSYLKLIRHDRRKEAERFYMRQFLRKKKNSYYEFPIIDGHGRERWIGQNAQPILGPDGFEGFQAIARDITERKKAELDLSRSRAFIERIAATTPGILYVYDILERRTLFSNREVVTVLGYKPDEMQAYLTNAVTHFHPDDMATIRSHHQALRHAADGEVRRIEYRARHRDGHWVWLAARDTPFERGRDGLVSQIVGIAQDVTARRAAQERLTWQANYDALTGLANRHHFWSRLQAVLRRTGIEQSVAALCLLDVDNFKEINDKYGHAAGDEVLEAVGSILRSELRSTDLSGRLGGDEFTFVLPGTDAHEAARLAERILDRLRTQAFGASAADTEPFLVTATFGVAESRPHMEARELMEAADRALYRAKAAGRNRVCIDA